MLRNFGGTSIFPSKPPEKFPVYAVKHLGQVDEGCIQILVMFLAFFLYLPNTKIMSVVLRSLQPHCDSGRMSLDIRDTRRKSTTRASTLPATVSRVPLLLLQTALSPFLLYITMATMVTRGKYVCNLQPLGDGFRGPNGIYQMV